MILHVNPSYPGFTSICQRRAQDVFKIEGIHYQLSIKNHEGLFIRNFDTLKSLEVNLNDF